MKKEKSFTGRIIRNNFYAMKVKLSTDFTQLGAVRIINNRMQDTQQMLEKEARQ